MSGEDKAKLADPEIIVRCSHFSLSEVPGQNGEPFGVVFTLRSELVAAQLLLTGETIELLAKLLPEIRDRRDVAGIVSATRVAEANGQHHD